MAKKQPKKKSAKIIVEQMPCKSNEQYAVF